MCHIFATIIAQETPKIENSLFDTSLIVGKSNNPTQIRPQNEFASNYAGTYVFQIKLGEILVSPAGFVRDPVRRSRLISAIRQLIDDINR